VRDAKIELAQGATTSRKTDLGFVPLLHIAGDRRFAPGWQLGLDAGALAGGPGRAEDVALTLGRDLGHGDANPLTHNALKSDGESAAKDKGPRRTMCSTRSTRARRSTGGRSTKS
jgi:hypothetical protein